MKKIKVILLATLLLSGVACSNEENLNDGQLVVTDEAPVQLTDAEIDVLYRLRNENNKVGIEEATRLAYDVIGFLDGESAVKSGTARSISSISGFGFKRTQSVALKSNDETDDETNVEIPDTVAYVFNFGDSDGYAIISADTRIEAPILAYAESGNLSDTIDNPGVILFLEGSEDYIVRSIADAEQKRDSLIAGIIAKFDAEAENESDTLDASDTKDCGTIPSGPAAAAYYIRTTITTGKWTTLSHVYPLSPVEWGQGDNFNEPFWRNVRYKNCDAGTSPAGCVAVAIAHIMSYWKYPASINGKSFNWTELNKYTGYTPNFVTGYTPNLVNRYKSWTDIISNAPPNIQTQAANLMENIGSKIGTSYGCGASGANSENAVKYLRSIGYKGGYTEGYNTNTIITSLNKKQPVVIRGDSYKTTRSYLFGLITSTSYSGGHSWVIDGYLYQEQSVTIKSEKISKWTGQLISQDIYTYYIRSYSIHNNWGWYGLDNGYYNAGSFNSNAKEVASNTKSGDAGNFQYEVKIFPYITR
jgi:hypothetical protein